MGSESRRLWLHDLQQDESRPIPGVEQASNPFWSPDSEFVLLKSGRGKSTLGKVSVQGGSATTICEVGLFRRGAVSNDGDTVVFSSGGGLRSFWQVPFGGGEPEEVFLQAEKEEIFAELFDGAATTLGDTPQFLPPEAGERVVVFGVGPPGTPRHRMMILDMDTRRRVLLPPGLEPAYSPTGHLIYSSGWNPRKLLALPFSLDKLEPEGQPFLIRENAQDPTVSQDGTLAYLDWAENAPQLVWRDRGGRKQSVLGPGIGPEISPDGSRVAFSYDGDIWLHDLDRKQKSKVTSDQAGDYRPVWSPDGKRLFFASERSGNFDIWKCELDRAGRPPELAFASPLLEIPNDMTPDGKRLVYHLPDDREGSWGRDISYLEYDEPTGEWKPRSFLATPNDEAESTLSPDDAILAISLTRPGGDNHRKSTLSRFRKERISRSFRSYKEE